MVTWWGSRAFVVRAHAAFSWVTQRHGRVGECMVASWGVGGAIGAVECRKGERESPGEIFDEEAFTTAISLKTMCVLIRQGLCLQIACL